MQVGHNCKLTASEVQQAVKLHVHALCVARGIAVPENALDFVNRASIHWVEDGSAMVTWEQ